MGALDDATGAIEVTSIKASSRRIADPGRSRPDLLASAGPGDSARLDGARGDGLDPPDAGGDPQFLGGQRSFRV